MTNQARRRQVDRFEKEARGFLSRTQRADVQASEHLRRSLFQPTASVCLLTLYGMPQIEEPLTWSWIRVRDSAPWQTCREEHPELAEQWHAVEGEYFEYDSSKEGTQYFREDERYIAAPFDRLGLRSIADYFRECFLPGLPGEKETEKLNRVLATSPPWLLWFTHGDVAAAVLGLTCPDLTSMRQYGRGKLNLDRLPEGPFELNVRPDGVEDQFYKKAGSRRLPDGLTPHERRRAIRVMNEFGNRLGR
jgi:hypothetical protein